MMKKLESSFRALGTDVSIEMISDKVAEDKGILAEIESRYHLSENTFSRFREDSELSFLNRHQGEWKEASPEMLAVSRKSLDLYDRSAGIFDPRVLVFLEKFGYDRDFKEIKPSQGENDYSPEPIKTALQEDLEIDKNRVIFRRGMDFSGIVKGFVADQTVGFLKEEGIENFLLDSGGDIYAGGLDGDREEWKISLEGFPEEKITFSLSNRAVATSGISRRRWERDGKRFHHLINPKSPDSFNFNLKSVSVLGESVLETDFWAKYLFLLGIEEGFGKAEEKKIEAIFLDYRGNARISSSARNRII